MRKLKHKTDDVALAQSIRNIPNTWTVDSRETYYSPRTNSSFLIGVQCGRYMVVKLLTISDISNIDLYCYYN